MQVFCVKLKFNAYIQIKPSPGVRRVRRNHRDSPGEACLPFIQLKLSEYTKSPGAVMPPGPFHFHRASDSTYHFPKQYLTVHPP